ncbi:aminoglycoside phosphotransferase family protein [Nocardia salmonicida]|uniref:aminoglycoside phosphotransferase family protein n=1 Tax=Nocardia salmonicida TaxID=53431 RepID=UPI0033F6F82C
MRSLFSSGGDDVAAVDVFANRHDEWASVVDSLRAHIASRPTVRVDDFVSPRSNVLVFYGVGGIGKTTFSKRLEAQMAATGELQPVASWSRLPPEVGPLVPVRIDLARQGEVSFEDALLAVRLAMGRLGQPLRAFDVALRCYWEVNHPGEPLEGYLRRHGFLRRMSDSMGLPQDMRTAVEDLSQAVELPSAAGATIVGFVSSLAQALRERRDKSLALSQCARLPDLLEAPQDIDTFSYFPHLLAWDLAQIPAKHAATPVILLDTFEDVTERGYREIEKLYQRMVWLMPNALFIITGRNRLQWDDETLEGQLDWAGRHRWPQLAPTAVGEPRQHLVGYLSDDDREQYLATRLTRAGEPVIPHAVRAEIATRSYGWPLYLDLAVMRFQELLARTGTAPGPQEFERDFPALVARVIRDLTADERIVLRTVSLLDAFSVDLATEASRLGYDAPALNLVERPFVSNDPDTPLPYRLHDLLRSAIRDADATTVDRWSPADWRRGAQSVFTALGTRVPATGEHRWRQTLVSYLTQGLRLACEYDLQPEWLLDAAWQYTSASIWEPVDIPDTTGHRGPSVALARTLHAIALRQRAHRRDSSTELTEVLAWNVLPPSIEDLARYYLAENQRHLGLHEESAANMRRVADGNSPLARPALRGLSHIARHLGDFPQALSTLEGLDHDSNYYRALGHLWWVHGNLNLACSAYATARRVAIDNDQAGIAALAQAGLAFAAALDDVDRATGQIARANDLLREVHQTWAQAQVRTAVLLQSVGADGDFTTHARELEHAYTEAGLGSALAYLRFVVCFHHAIRDDQQQLRDALTNLELSTNNGEYRYLREIVSFLPVMQPDPPASGARWIGGRDSVAHAWREVIGRRRAALGLNPPVNPMSAARVGGMSGPSSDSFSAESTYRTLELAAGETGIPIQDARLIRMGENAIYALPHANVVARIARSDQRLARVEKELAIGRWLAYHDYPAVRVAEHLPQPVRVDGRVVTYWNLVEPDGEVTIDQFAGLLRDFHALPAPEFTLDLFDPFAAVPGRLANAGDADPAAVAFLADMHHDLRTRYDALEFTDLGVIHGDAHRGNIIPTANGPLLCDFEVAARGPWQWDTTSLAIAVDRLGTPAADYTEFVRVYGRDVTQQPQFPVLRAARELTMTTWLMQLIDVSPGHATEFTHRISSLRDGNLQQRWNGF